MKDKHQQPGIRCDAIILAEQNFKRKPNIPDTSRIDFNISVDKSVNEAEKKGQLHMKAELKLISDADEVVLNLNATFIGFFSVDEDAPNMELDKFLENNAPAIIFPYIREHIGAVTQKAGIKPLILPPLNVFALINKER